MNQKEKDQLIQELEDYFQGKIKILFSGKDNTERIVRILKSRI